MSEKRKFTRLADGVTLIKGIDFECCIWLVEGSDSALLIDTGLGVGNLREEVEQYTNLPYRVVNTHGHGDHSGGNYLFDEVFMHRGALECADIAFEMTKRFVTPEETEAIFRRKAENPVKISFIEEGYVFDLGSRRLEVFETPGHTPGDITLFDRENGLLFSGDCMLKAMDVLLVVPQTITVECYAKSIHKLAALEGVKGFCSGHDQRIMPRSFLTDCMNCADEILAGTSNGAQIESHLPDGEKYCMRATHGDAAIMYRSYKIR